LLQILGTLSKPDTGKVVIDGVDLFSLNSNSLSDFRNRKIGVHYPNPIQARW